MAKEKARLEIVRGETGKLSKWAPVTWKHPEQIRKPDPENPQGMNRAQLYQWAQFYGERPAHLVWPFVALALMTMGALMVTAALS